MSLPQPSLLARFPLRAAAPVAALLALGLLFHITRSQGVGLTPDSVDYLSAADSLRAGQGMIQADGRTFVLWPPLYPLLLAGIGELAGVSSHHAALLLNAASLALLVLLSARLTCAATGSQGAGAVVAFLVALSPDVLWLHAMAYSEGVFMLLLVSLALATTRWLERPGRKRLVVLGLTGALLCLQRYFGVVEVALAALLLATRSTRAPGGEVTRGSPLSGLAVAVSAALPLGAWALRNRAISGPGMGDRGWGHGQDVGQILERLCVVAGEWLWPAPGTSMLDVAATVALLLGLAGALWLGLQPGPRRHAQVAVAAQALWYLVGQVLANATLELDGIHVRQLSPVLPLALVSVVGLGVAALRRATSRVPAASRVWPALGMLFLATHLGATGLRLQQVLGRWPSALVPYGYNQPIWVESDIVGWVRDNPLPGELYSNDPHGFYFCAGLRSKALPGGRHRFRALGRQLGRADVPASVLWFQHNPRSVVPLELLEASVDVIPRFEGSQGTVYELRPRAPGQNWK